MKLLSNLGTALEPLYVVHDVPIYCHNHPTQTDVFNAAIKHLKDILQTVDWPEISGHQLLSLSTKNVTDTAGAISIDVSTLENPVTLGTIQLRDNAGAFEFSTDGGSTWQPVGAEVDLSALPQEVHIGNVIVRDSGNNTLEIWDTVNAQWNTLPDDLMLLNAYLPKTATTDAVNEGATNKYYTEARVSANADVAANTTHRNTTGIHEKPKVNGVEVVTLDPANLTDQGGGAFKIEVGLLKTLVTLGTVELADVAGQLSVKIGETYVAILNGSDTDIMRRYTYDTDDNGIIDKAEELFNGTDVITIADVQQLQSDVSTLQSALSALDARVTALEGV